MSDVPAEKVTITSSYVGQMPPGIFASTPARDPAPGQMFSTSPTVAAPTVYENTDAPVETVPVADPVVTVAISSEPAPVEPVVADEPKTEPKEFAQTLRAEIRALLAEVRSRLQRLEDHFYHPAGNTATDELVVARGKINDVVGHVDKAV